MLPLLMAAIALAADPVDARPVELHEPVIGYAVRELTDVKDIIESKGGKPPGGKGVIISDIVPHSPADLAGLRVFDVIRVANGKPVENPSEALPEGLKAKAGTEIVLKVVQCTTSQSGKPTWGKSRSVTLKVETRGAIGVNAMQVTEDPVEKTVWVRHKGSPKGVAATNDLSLYFQLNEKTQPHNLRLKLGYHGDEWIFMKSFSFRIGEHLHTIQVSHFEANREALLGNGVTEWIDLPIAKQAATALRAVSEPGEVILRLSGDKLFTDRKISNETRMILHQTLDAYQWLGGVIDAEPAE